VADFSQQNTYFCGLVKYTLVKQWHLVISAEAYKAYIYYFLHIDSESTVICKQYLHTCCVSNGRLRRALKKGNAGCAVGGICGVNSPVLLKLLKTCLMKLKPLSFSSCQSYYTCCQNPNGKYQDCNLNVRKMYKWYEIEWCLWMTCMVVGDNKQGSHELHILSQ
jgi:hypothetical protein